MQAVVQKLGLEGEGPGLMGAGRWGSQSAVGWAPPDRLPRSEVSVTSAGGAGRRSWRDHLVAEHRVFLAEKLI